MREDIPIMELHVHPTYAVCIPQRNNRGRKKSVLQIRNEENLKVNELKGKLSKKASQRLTNSVNWLVASAKSKSVYDKISSKRFSFKINFITLTLPSTDHKCTDHQFKKVLLHNFINTCRHKFGLKNYVWKVETQSNGNIHAHFTTDSFIHWKDLRSVWNRILIKNNLMDSYTEKHACMSLAQYSKEYNSNGKKSKAQILKAYNFGTSSSWQSPNSTDVHAVWKVKDIAAYLATYMAKKDDGRRLIKGRLWGCSQNLSATNKLVLELHGNEDNDLLDSLFKHEIKYKEILSVSAVSNSLFRVGEIFFFKISDWGTVITGRLLQAFNEHRFNIRNSIDVLGLTSFKESADPPLRPIVVSSPISAIDFSHQLSIYQLN